MSKQEEATAGGSDALPKLVVFDLDATLWWPEMYMLRGQPFRKVCSRIVFATLVAVPTSCSCAHAHRVVWLFTGMLLRPGPSIRPRYRCWWRGGFIVQMVR